MLLADATWGDVRRIHQRALENPDIFIEDDYLADPEIAAKGASKLDSDLFFDYEFDEDIEYTLTENEDKSVASLLKFNVALGTMYRRLNSEWVQVMPEDEGLDLELPYSEVSSRAISTWDNSNKPLYLDDFEDSLLDGV